VHFTLAAGLAVGHQHRMTAELAELFGGRLLGAHLSGKLLFIGLQLGCGPMPETLGSGKQKRTHQANGKDYGAMLHGFSLLKDAWPV
jgi:hypothetical protein